MFRVKIKINFTGCCSTFNLTIEEKKKTSSNYVLEGGKNEIDRLLMNNQSYIVALWLDCVSISSKRENCTGTDGDHDFLFFTLYMLAVSSTQLI